MIFGTLNPEKILHEKNLTYLSILLVRCSHFQQYYSYILLIIYVISEENNL